MKRFDLMHSINVRGTFMVSKYCIPHLQKSSNPHILTLSPPLNLKPEWFGAHLGYTMAKYGMSMTVLGLADELKSDGIAVNALWPQTTIATAAVKFALGGDAMIQCSRTPAIMAMQHTPYYLVKHAIVQVIFSSMKTCCERVAWKTSSTMP